MSIAFASPNAFAEEESLSEIDDTVLMEHETWWRDHYLMLEERGYRLRPRFHPDWVPSWLTSGINMASSEDSNPSNVCLPALFLS